MPIAQYSRVTIQGVLRTRRNCCVKQNLSETENMPVPRDSVPFCLFMLGTNHAILIAYSHYPTYAPFNFRKSGASRIVQKLDFSTHICDYTCRLMDVQFKSNLNKIMHYWPQHDCPASIVIDH